MTFFRAFVQEVLLCFSVFLHHFGLEVTAAVFLRPDRQKQEQIIVGDCLVVTTTASDSSQERDKPQDHQGSLRGDAKHPTGSTYGGSTAYGGGLF
ncbi:unnamed protein product, partial [Amoebophrya sp. A25]|eukprot:GSA25T00002376001.1